MDHKDCIFCKIINKEAPASIVAESDQAIAIKSIQPAAEIHLLILPKEHVESFLTLSADANIINDMAKLIQTIIKDQKLEQGYKLVINGGRYQAINHLHWHLLAGKLENQNDVLNKT